MRRTATHREPGVIGRDLDPDGPMPTEHRPRKPWEERARARNEQQTEAMATLRQMVQHLGGIFENTKAAPRNDVLAQMTQTIPANGVLHRGWEQLAQAFTISNFGSGPLTVTTQGIQSQPPTVGSGVALVPGGIERTVMLRGNAVTIYGAPGTIVEFVAYARPRPPHSSLCSSAPVPPVVLAVANPAAGAQFSANPSPGAPFTLAGIAYTLTTSATVANRQAGIAVAGLVSFANVTQTATLVEPYSFFPGAPTVANTVEVALPTGPFPAGTLVASDVTGLQAADQISAISLLISPQAVA